MSELLGNYSLRLVRTAQDWIAYHAIRRDAIFAPLLPGQAYDESDPDEFRPGNLPHVLVRDGKIVGTAHRPHRRDASGAAPDRHPQRPVAPRPRRRSAQVGGRNSAGARPDRGRHQRPSDVADVLSRQRLSRRWMARRRPGAGDAHSGRQAVVVDHHTSAAALAAAVLVPCTCACLVAPTRTLRSVDARPCHDPRGWTCGGSAPGIGR
jgi:hypothetical protein